MRGDLHLHTSKSDGVWPPERLFEEIRLRALGVFSITDHDCIDAYPVPADLQSRVIPGMEVDSVHRKQTAHLLAYGVESAESPLLQALRKQHEDRLPRMRAMVERLDRLGIPITLEDVVAQAVGTDRLQRPHLARALVAKGVVDSVEDAFERFLDDTCDAYVPLERMSSRAVIDLIHQSGGAAVIAHPMRLLSARTMGELCDLGADGVEVYSPSASPEDQRAIAEFAEGHNLLMTGGTDFHAPGRDIGVEIEERQIDALRTAVRGYRAHAGT